MVVLVALILSVTFIAVLQAVVFAREIREFGTDITEDKD